MTFGARLASFKFDDNDDVWWVGLEPKSGVFITHTKALEAMGWPRGAEAECRRRANHETRDPGRS